METLSRVAVMYYLKRPIFQNHHDTHKEMKSMVSQEQKQATETAFEKAQMPDQRHP